MTVATYLSILNTRYKTGISREHTYRGDLQTLLSALLPDILVTNEPSRIDCGAPDYVLTRKDVPVGYIEAKDIGVDLNSKALKEQFDRYRSGLSNLIFTDYLDFHFYKDGVFITSVAIAKIEHGGIIPMPDNFATFEALIKNFAQTVSQTIKSPTKLAEMMAGKAKLMADVIEKSLKHDDETGIRSSLKLHMLSFRQMLIHDITNSGFADIYSQTIAYGMFAARYHDPTLPTFSREEAATLIPRSNPFLRKLFQDIAGYDLDDRLVWIVDELVNIFLATDVADIMKNFGKSTKQEDPVVHFYETFLATYNSTVRKERGVWYTPQPVVNFIVRAVDEILKTEFNLAQGLADTSKIKIKKKVIKLDDRAKNKSKIIGEKFIEHEIHRVQILDPATGTGTFLAEIVKHIYKRFEGQQGIWNNYVSQHLIPRLNGFELLMASYAMAHLKMDMLLTETGYKATSDQRFRIFLTNSLEEAHPDTGTLFSALLSDEADHANALKRDSPVMVVIGNPPYNGESANKGEWIMKLMEDYKKEPGGKEKLKERNPKWLNDDYVKFMRFSQHFIEKNGSGVLAFINPHGFLDNPTFRGMRWNLLKTYDKIYTLDLHGNSKKKEVSPDGSPDINVFDIMQGVSINLFIKKGEKKDVLLGKQFHYDLFGKREFKYSFLSNNSISSIPYKEVQNKPPMYFMVDKDFGLEDQYLKGFELSRLFKVNSVGIVTGNDSLIINEDSHSLKIALKNSYSDSFDERYIQKIQYRPFDVRHIYYDSRLIARSRLKVMQHFLINPNVGLALCKQYKSGQVYRHVLVCNNLIESSYVSNKTSEITSVFPLYLYSEPTSQTTFDEKVSYKPNLDITITTKFAEITNLQYSNKKSISTSNSKFFDPIDLLDYIYAILYSPTYRERFKEFLKIDFPRIPYPANSRQFFDLVTLGRRLRELHLLESPNSEKYITKYPVDGNNEIVKPLYKERRVYINDGQYFDNVPEIAWDFYIGGYQPAQKWLKDRKGQTLDFEDVLHYQKIIVALTETNRLMGEIDKIGFE